MLLRSTRIAALLLIIIAPMAGAQSSQEVVQIRSVYLSAVDDASAIPAGLRLIEDLRAREAGSSDRDAYGVLAAYEGAFVALRAKHGVWPPARLRHLRDGLALMDAAVADRGDHAEIRYLRLLSCYFLPGILGRSDSVQEDFDALARLLPYARAEYAPALYRTMVEFVLQNGRLEGREARALEGVLPRPADE